MQKPGAEEIAREFAVFTILYLTADRADKQSLPETRVTAH